MASQIVMDRTGDTRHMFDKQDRAEVAKAEQRFKETCVDRNYLKGRVGDRINAVLAAAGYNFGLLLRWLAELLRAIIRAFAETVRLKRSLKSAVVRVLHG